MTEQEREIKRVIRYIRSCRNAGIDATITIDKIRSHFILNALEEIQQYRAIGTVEECREAMEKQKPRNIRISHIGDAERGKAFCPNCGLDIHGKWKLTYCFLCGQKLDWSE